jgi:hypothetical protein
MSAFGQAGFGSRNRQNQLRAQGQMDPYGNQVRQAKQAPTFNIYSQPQAPSSRPATPRRQSASMPAYGGQPQTGGPMPTMGQAQPIQSAGGGTSSQQGGQIPTYDDWMRGQQQTGGPTPTYPGVTQPSTPPSQPQTGGPFPTYDDWMSGQGSSNYVNPPTGGPFPTYDSVMGPQTGGPMPTMGQAQPIQPASTGTPAGLQQRDWAGNGVRNSLQRMGPGESFGGMTQAAREWAGSLSSGPPAARRDNETAAEASARLDAEMAYARQQEVLGRIAETEKREREFATRVIDPASLPQNQPGYNPFPGGVTFADFWGPNAMQAQSWHRNYNPDGSKRIIGWGGGGIGVAPQPIYAR